MKKNLLFSLIISGFATSFTAQKGIDDVIGSLRAGDVSGLARYFDNYIDITLPDKSSNYSKSQGQLILKDFFSGNEVKGFELKHKGNNDNREYAIGTLQTKNGNYRTTVYMKMKSNKQVIQDIQIQ
jgi:hypothetical protein